MARPQCDLCAPVRHHSLKVPESPSTVPWVGDQMYKHQSLQGALHLWEHHYHQASDLPGIFVTIIWGSKRPWEAKIKS